MAIIPDPAVYGMESAAALDAYNKALVNVKAKQAGLYQQYGLTADTNPDGSYSNVRVDPNAQYGQVQQLHYNQGQQLESAYDNAEQRGIGHEGLGAQQESKLRFQQGADNAALGAQFTGALSDLFQQRNDALNTYNQANTQAQLDAINTAIANREFTPVKPVTAAKSGNAALAGSQAARTALSKATIARINRSPNVLRRVGSDAAQGARPVRRY